MDSAVVVLAVCVWCVKVHGWRTSKHLTGVLVKFLQLAHNYLNHDRRRCATALNKYIPLLK